jgi:hypothetical protein
VTEWWQGLASAQAAVDCGGARHRLRWDRGAFQALDHGDVESERTLAALGGESCTCLDLLEAWDRHHEDLRVLVLASRGPTDILAVHEDGGAAFSGTQPHRLRRSSGWAAYAPPGRGPRAQPVGRMSRQAGAEAELLALLGLGGGLPDRLVATVAAAWHERLGRTGRPPARSRAQLEAALHGRVLAVMRSWLGACGPELRVRMIGEKGKPKLAAEDDHVQAELPFGWLVEVWAHGLGTIWGRFCLAARGTDDGRTWKLTTVGPDLDEPSVVTLKLGA